MNLRLWHSINTFKEGKNLAALLARANSLESLGKRLQASLWERSAAIQGGINLGGM
jgi:hypothetical protein